MTAPVVNITERGARRRRLGGVIWLAVALLANVAMVAVGARHAYRLALFVPFGLSAIGFFQARA
jgi:hypothetical protein